MLRGGTMIMPRIRRAMAVFAGVLRLASGYAARAPSTQTRIVDTTVMMALLPIALRMLPLEIAAAKLPKKISAVGKIHCNDRSVRDFSAVDSAT
jgi:hypothetical protein